MGCNYNPVSEPVILQILDVDGGQSFNGLLGEIASFTTENGAISYLVINNAPTVYSVATVSNGNNNETTVTIDRDGLYRFSIDFTVGQLAGTSRTEFTGRLERNGVSEPGAMMKNYNRQSGYEQTGTIDILLNVTAGDEFTFRGSVTQGNGVPISSADGSRWNIERLGDIV